MRIIFSLLLLMLTSCNKDECNIFEQDIKTISEIDTKTLCLIQENGHYVCDREGNFETCWDERMDVFCYNDNGSVICK